MVTNVYDVYNADGKKIMTNVLGKEVAAKLNVDPIRVAQCSNTGQRIRRIYKIVKSGELTRGDGNTASDAIIMEWERVVAPLRNVIWVKSEEEGARKLVFNGAKNKFDSYRI